MLLIRPATEQNFDAIWDIIHAVISTGDTYMFDPMSSRDKMLAYWCATEAHTYVAEDGGNILGTYVIRDNRPDLGSHIANGSYMVSPHARGMGLGKLLGRHSIDSARGMGYKAMQFNYVVKSNMAAVMLWQSLGFKIVGEIPGAFKHHSLGYVNVYVMWRSLEEKED